MSDNKKYYWLKLPTDFFEDKAIKRLRQIAGGDTYTIIYLKMLLKSLEDEGKLFYEGVEESISEEIALDINESFDDVQVTINYLVKKGLMQVTENEAEMLRMNELIGSETEVARRVRKHRKLQCNAKLLQSNTNVTKCNTDIDIEKDKDKDIDIEKDINTISSELKPSPVAISLPLNDKTFRDITEDEISQYQELYPNVNVSQELRNMLGWLNANPTKRKTRRGINKFVNNWLSRSQDKGQQTSTTAKANEKGTWWF